MTAPQNTQANGGILDLVLFFVSLVFVAFFAAYEIAYVTIERSKLRLWFKGRFGKYLAERPERILAANLIGTNIASVSAAVFLTQWLIARMNSAWSAVLSGLITTVTIVFFGEILPKNFARKKNEPVVKYLSWLILIMYGIGIILIIPLENFIRKIIVKGHEFTPKERSKQEIEKLILKSEENRILDDNSARLLRDALYFYEKHVEDLMTTVKTVPALPVDAPIDMFIEVARENREPWILVYNGDIDNIQGYILVRDILYLKIHGGNIERFIREVAFVYVHWTVNRVIDEIKGKGTDIAVVFDEYGGVVGVLDKEQIMAELLDSLYGYGIVKKDRGEVYVDGDTELEELRELGIDIDIGEEHSVNTISGLILSMTRQDLSEDMDIVGLEAELGDYIAKVLEVDDSGVIKRVLLRKKEPKEDKKGGDKSGEETV